MPIERHINYVDKSISSPLHLAVRGGNLEVIKLCITHGAKIDQQQVEKSRVNIKYTQKLSGAMRLTGVCSSGLQSFPDSEHVPVLLLVRDMVAEQSPVSMTKLLANNLSSL